MNKKRSMVILSVLLVMSMLLAACGGKNNANNAANGNSGNSGKSGAVKTVKVFQFKTEIVEGLNELKVEFEKEYPNIKLDIQTVGGGADYAAALKTKFASGDAPDIFSNGGFAELDMWQDKIEDLSDQAWVKDLVPLAAEPMTKDGKVYGMPMNLEGIGYVYNKDLFAKAGITETPKTITELEEAAKKLQAAGITPFGNAYQEWWLLGNQGISTAFARQDNVDEFIKGLNEGTQTIVGNQQFKDWSNLLNLTVKYGQKNPLTTDANTHLALFANSEIGMMQEGNWAQTLIDNITPGMNIGMFPMPIDDNAEKNDKLTVGIPANLVVNKDSASKEEAKIFLNWLVTSDMGKEYIVKKWKFIPALTTIPASAEDIGMLGADVKKYVDENKVYGLQSSKFPDGVTQEFASAIQELIAGKTDVNGWMTNMQAAWDKLKK
ncbi:MULTISPECIES: ABC transporter substrate-binding protein [Paenibacillus]|uniref:ABC transporter substrate-binding protein n=1 Tax=Paenibacillus vini TaxID=1476024 RepID=A0ABQ4MDD3_9BACL|nr:MULTISPECIES: extracellular solute-binding protein [Paenibacillus]MBQ4899154.1 extracellular solute-binding protein [Paenibacillus sp. Marseille-P2973]MDN4068640.1 extracellular solute-binding protein [Paenibacillus vini]GIP53975.1 ABC transporter substrate-binding protein [Paenibacillus vini]